MEANKFCKYCNKAKSINDFSKVFLKKYGRYQLRAICKICRIEEYHQKAKEKRIRNNLPIINLKNEVWKDIDGWENLYQISTKGRVKSLEKLITCNNRPTLINQKLLISIQTNQYLRVSMSKNNHQVIKSIHRLVAQTFIPNPENKPYVNHKNGIKTDNNIENLEWCTPKENTYHALKTGLMDTKGHKNGYARNVIQISLDGFIIGVYSTLIEAQNSTGIDFKQISAATRGKQKTAKGYYWK